MQRCTDEILVLICCKMDSASSVCYFGSTNKSMKSFLSTEAKAVWSKVVYNVCGHEVVDGGQPIQFRAMATIAPYLAKRQVHQITQGDIKRFEIAKRKDDGAAVLWIEAGSLAYHVQLSGESRRTTLDDLEFQEKSIPVDVGLREVKDWAEFHAEGRFTTLNCPFYQGQITIQVHKNLYMSCIRSNIAGDEDCFILYRSPKEHTLVFFKQVGASIHVLCAMPTMAGEFTGEDGISNLSAFVSFDRAMLCVRVHMHEVHCFGPEVDRDRLCYGQDRVNVWELSPAVSLRLILDGKRSNSDLIHLDELARSADRVTNLPIPRCIVESRNLELCKDIVSVVRGSAAGSSMLFSAVKMGDADIVRLLMDYGLDVDSSNYGGRILTRCMTNPEIAEIVFNRAKKEDLDNICIMYINMNIDFKPLCEPVLHILKRKKTAIFDSGPAQLELMKNIFAMGLLEEDPGKLIMCARFLRTLILEGEPLTKRNQNGLLLEAKGPSLASSRIYMTTFLTSMGMKVEDDSIAARLSRTVRSVGGGRP
jgi:hypothetical protein